MTPANVVEVLFPPVVRLEVLVVREMELVALLLAMEPTVLASPIPRARTPLLLMVTALRPVAPPKALTDPAVRVPLLMTVVPE